MPPIGLLHNGLTPFFGFKIDTISKILISYQFGGPAQGGTGEGDCKVDKNDGYSGAGESYDLETVEPLQ